MEDDRTTPGCGRLVGKDAWHCQSCDGSEPPLREAITPVIRALQRLLERLMDERIDVETQARYLPRVATSIVQAVRLRHQTGSQADTRLNVQIEDIIREIENETMSDAPSA